MYERMRLDSRTMQTAGKGESTMSQGLAIFNHLITLIISKGFYYWQRKHQ